MTKANKRESLKKTFLGMPMRWERDKIFKNLWNKTDDRVFPPKYFGIGWDLNLHALLKKTHLVKSADKTK
jgi:hypothetical protein